MDLSTAVWFLIVSINGTGGAVIPTPYASMVDCLTAGEEAHRNIQRGMRVTYACAPVPKAGGNDG